MTAPATPEAVAAQLAASLAVLHAHLVRLHADAAHRMPLQLPETEPVDTQGTYSMFVYALRILVPRYVWAQNLQIYNFRTLQVV